MFYLHLEDFRGPAAPATLRPFTLDSLELVCSQDMRVSVANTCLAAVERSWYSPRNHEIIATFMTDRVRLASNRGFNSSFDALLRRAANAAATTSSTSNMREW